MPLHDPTLPLLFLYAETHFRFFHSFPSLLYRRSPEVLFDLPRRISPGVDLPILLLCNDIDRFPIDIRSVAIAISQGEKTWKAWEGAPGSPLPHPRDSRMRAYLFRIPRASLQDGMCTVNATVTTADNTLILNDNFPSTSQKAFPVFLSDEPLPGSGLCSYGDLHTHSHYSESHVEFGPPITVIAQMAEAYGLDFVAVTDHSYDLECRIDDIYRKDHDGTRWSLLDQELNCLAGQQVTVIKGEEVSVMNATGSVVHLCALGVNTMLPGGRDGARRNARNAKTLSISNAVEEIHRQRGLSVAAHPGARSGLLQHLFLGRGGWQDRDVQDGLDAYQALNGAFNSQWYRAKRQWVRKLLHGLRLPLVAGNDAHGDFNRYRALTVPFVAVGEDFLRSFANCRTGVYGRRDTPESILTAIRQGRTFVTNGPFLTLSLTELPDEPAISQQNIPGTTRSLFAHVQSCYEFGKPVILRLLRGYFQTGKERPLLVCAPRLHNSYCGLQEIALDRDNGPGYIRAEVVCRTDGNRIFEAATSPCYFD